MADAFDPLVTFADNPIDCPLCGGKWKDHSASDTELREDGSAYLTVACPLPPLDKSIYLSLWSEDGNG